MVLQHERQHFFDLVEDSQTLTNVVGYKKSNSRLGNSSAQSNTYKSKICTNCGKNVHTIEVCYQKHGFPPHFGKGPMIKNIVANDDVNEVNTHISPVNNGSSTITQDQYDKLVHLLQNSTINQGISPAASNQVGSSSFIGHSSLNDKRKLFSLHTKDAN